MLGLTGFLGLTRISFFCSHRFHRFHYCFVGGKSHRWFCVWAGSHGFHFAFGLTQISQIPRYCFVGGKSQMVLRVGWLARIPLCFWAHGSHRSHGIALWVGNLTDGSACGLARADSALFLGSHGSHRSHSIALWVGNLTDASVRGLARADSTLLLGSHGSHRSHGVALWVGNLTDASACVDLCGLRWGHIALALTDLFFGPFGQIRPIGPIGQIGHF